jgi:hypothetical protein
MSYEAIVCKLKNIRSHPNADRLALSTISGYQTIIGLDYKEDQLGVFFPAGGKLSEKHLYENNLYTHSNLNKDTEKKGYFSDNGRVKAVKLRGEISEGFWQPIECFYWTGASKFREGDSITILKGELICEKYVTPATQRAINKRNKQTKQEKIRSKTDYSMLAQHYDTKQVRNNVHKIPEGALIYITEKLHGSSGRTGYIKVETKYFGWKAWINKFLPVFQTEEWKYTSGTRRVIMMDNYDGYYHGTLFRQTIHDKIADLGLYKGECLYYEIVGYTQNQGNLIMGKHNIDDKAIKEKYGNEVSYTYGCKEEEFKVFVYRITMVNDDNVVTEYSWPQVQARCATLGLETVPLLFDPYSHRHRTELLKILSNLSDGPSTLDDSHPREGVVVRIEDKEMFTALKWKGETFCLLENIRQNDPNFIDPEDVE